MSALSAALPPIATLNQWFFYHNSVTCEASLDRKASFSFGRHLSSWSQRFLLFNGFRSAVWCCYICISALQEKTSRYYYSTDMCHCFWIGVDIACTLSPIEHRNISNSIPLFKEQIYARHRHIMHRHRLIVFWPWRLRNNIDSILILSISAKFYFVVVTDSPLLLIIMSYMDWLQQSSWVALPR